MIGLILAATKKEEGDVVAGWVILLWLVGGLGFVLFVDGIDKGRWWEILFGILMWGVVLLGFALARGLM